MKTDLHCNQLIALTPLHVTFSSLAINSIHLCTRADHSESLWVVLMSTSRITRLAEIWHHVLSMHSLLQETNCLDLSMTPSSLISSWFQLIKSSPSSLRAVGFSLTESELTRVFCQCSWVFSTQPCLCDFFSLFYWSRVSVVALPGVPGVFKNQPTTQQLVSAENCPSLWIENSNCLCGFHVWVVF